MSGSLLVLYNPHVDECVGLLVLEVGLSPFFVNPHVDEAGELNGMVC